MLELDFAVERADLTVRIALAVGAGERVALFGPSGSGKTTLLEAIAGLTTIAQGHIVLDGQTLDGQTLGGQTLGSPVPSTPRRPPRRPPRHEHRSRAHARVLRVPIWQRQVGFLRQDDALFPHLSVLENLGYGAPPWHTPANLGRVIETLELGTVLDARPHQLSGGQARRVACGRVLLSDYRVLLLDEPSGGLDARLGAKLASLASTESSSRKVPTMLVTHDLAEAQGFADRLGVIDQGVLLDVDYPGKIVHQPATRRIAELVGYSSFLPAETRANFRDETGVTIGIHPDRVLVGEWPSRGVVITGTLCATLPAGGNVIVELATGNTRIAFRALESLGAPGLDITVTAVDPPFFASNGTRFDP